MLYLNWDDSNDSNIYDILAHGYTLKIRLWWKVTPFRKIQFPFLSSSISYEWSSLFLWGIFLISLFDNIYNIIITNISKQWVKVSWKWYLMNGNRMTRKKTRELNFLFTFTILFLVILLLISLCFSWFLKFTWNHISIQCNSVNFCFVFCSLFSSSKNF